MVDEPREDRDAEAPRSESPPPEKAAEIPPQPTPEIPDTARPQPEEAPKPEGPQVPPPSDRPEITLEPDRPENPAQRRGQRSWFAELPEVPTEVPRSRLAAQSRRDFLLFAAGVAAAAVGTWWLLPDRAKGRLLGGARRDRLDTLAGRVGLSRANREKALDQALTFDDDVAEALYSTDRRVRTYAKSERTPLRNNYHGRTPGPEHIAGWKLTVSGLAAGANQVFSIEQLLARFPFREQVTRLVCVEGWSAVAWWGGIRFADLLATLPPAPTARWAALRSSVSLDGAGRTEPYFVSIDLGTARHPQTLLATHQDGKPLSLAHGAPLRLLAPMKLGLKNIKAVTDIAYTADEPPDYWNQMGYSKYDGL